MLVVGRTVEQALDKEAMKKKGRRRAAELVIAEALGENAAGVAPAGGFAPLAGNRAGVPVKTVKLKADGTW